eukprot:PhM_4_TR18425/c4_g1_i3/m.85290
MSSEEKDAITNNNGKVDDPQAASETNSSTEGYLEHKPDPSTHSSVLFSLDVPESNSESAAASDPTVAIAQDVLESSTTAKNHNSDTTNIQKIVSQDALVPPETENNDETTGSHPKSDSAADMTLHKQSSSTAAPTTTAPQPPPTSEPPKPDKSSKKQQVLKKHKGFYPPDGPVVRYWYALQLICAAYSYISATRTIVYDDTHSTGELLFGLVISCVFIVDCHVHSRLVRPTYRLVGLDVIPALPFEVVLLATPLTHSWRILLSCVRALKLMRVPSMFRMSMPDVINTHYVLFYYKVLPTTLFIYWFMLFLHMLVVVRSLVAEVAESYNDSIFWVWTFMTSAPFEVKIRNESENVYAGILMTVAMILQGYVVGAMSVLVFSYNVEEETRTQMLTTLEMLKHYDLPVEARDEVLSFQHHTLAESHVRASSHATLDKLPPAMLRQIQLY